MSEIRALIEQLVKAGVDPVEAAEVVSRAAIHGAVSAPKTRSVGAIRQERYRRNKASQMTKSDALLDKDAPHTPQEIKPSNIPPSPPKGGSSPIDRAIDVFSEEAKRANLPVPRKVTADRRRKIDARLREHGESVWAEACRKMAESPFCRGENDRGWRADLDFLCQPKSFNGLIEGKYDSRPSFRQQATDPPHQLDRVNAFLDEIQGKPRATQSQPNTIDGSFERADRSGAPNLVQLHAVSARSRS